MASCALVLIMDDDPATLTALPDLLTARLKDVTVDACMSAMTGLEPLRRTNDRVLVAELRMPQMDGLALLRAVHELREYTPVVIMSDVTNRPGEAHGRGSLQKLLVIGRLRGRPYSAMAPDICRTYCDSERRCSTDRNSNLSDLSSAER